MARYKIYTGQGDGGKTRLYGGRIVFKDDPRIEVCGTLDELNCLAGLLLSVKPAGRLKKVLRSVQNDLFLISAELAAPVMKGKKAFKIKFDKKKIRELESSIDDLNQQLPLLKNFILPGGAGTSPTAAWLHLLRSVCRRAERRLVTLSRGEKIDGNIQIYLNRLSDLFFMLARYDNHIKNKKETIWKNPEGG
jgi:cob(I)alamin adenosyltransferase